MDASESLSILPIVTRIHLSSAHFNHAQQELIYNTRDIFAIRAAIGPRPALAAWANSLCDADSSPWRLERFSENANAFAHAKAAPIVRAGPGSKAVGLIYKKDTAHSHDSRVIMRPSPQDLCSPSSNEELDRIAMMGFDEFSKALLASGLECIDVELVRVDGGSGRPPSQSFNLGSAHPGDSALDTRAMALCASFGAAHIERLTLLAATPESARKKRGPL